jgi:predicted Zn-dependent protease
VAGGVAHRAGYTTQVLDRWRSDRYTKWMTRGRELANAADYHQAATCFRRATRAQPVKGVAWYHLAIALLEDGRPSEVLDVVDEARRGEAIIDELDFLDLEAQAARRAGDHERCREAVARLADGSEAMATTLVRDLGLSEEALGHELATRLSWEEDEEALPGYV